MSPVKANYQYVYGLRSFSSGKFYTGCTNDLRKRFTEHQQGLARSTKGQGPFDLIYYEACLNSKDAYAREKYLKTGLGKRYRMKRFLALTG